MILFPYFTLISVWRIEVFFSGREGPPTSYFGRRENLLDLSTSAVQPYYPEPPRLYSFHMMLEVFFLKIIEGHCSAYYWLRILSHIMNNALLQYYIQHGLNISYQRTMIDYDYDVYRLWTPYKRPYTVLVLYTFNWLRYKYIYQLSVVVCNCFVHIQLIIIHINQLSVLFCTCLTHMRLIMIHMY